MCQHCLLLVYAGASYMPGLVGGQLGQQLPDTNREQANSHQANKLRRRAFGCAADCLNRLYGVSYNCGVLGQAVAERLGVFCVRSRKQKAPGAVMEPPYQSTGGVPAVPRNYGGIIMQRPMTVIFSYAFCRAFIRSPADECWSTE